MSAPAMTAEAAKRLATAMARLALRRHVLHLLKDEAGAPLFVVTLGAFTRCFDGPTALSELEGFVDRVAGAST